jgi:DNA (cytosine-5)-methyltransferase 1
MSDVLGGKVDRDIGFTLRVGGKSSPIDDRRNWDGYRVNGRVRRLTPDEAKLMNGFPARFRFPKEVPDSEAMKQLGNSVAVDAVKDYASRIIEALDELPRRS